jgi:phosphatidylglycerol:prolipoprotein diacylglycerol transferase
MNPSDIDDLVVWAALGVIGGGRIGYVLFYAPQLVFTNPLEIIAVWHGGMSFHGGFLGAILAMVIFARRRKIPTWSVIDVIAPSTTFGLFLGRIANFINGEVYGRVSDAPWAMVFPEGGPQPRHPSQLYEALLEGVVLFLILRVLTHHYRKLGSRGFVSGAFCAGYGVMRTLVELVREPDTEIGPLVGGLTMGMVLSIPMIAFGIGLMIWASRRTASPAASEA